MMVNGGNSDVTHHQLLAEVHRVLREMSAAAGSTERAELERLRSGVWDMLRTAREFSPTVFAMYGTDLWLGPADRPARYFMPDLAGIGDAYAILYAWVVTQRPLHASSLKGAPSGNALNGRLTRAADWVERTAGCRDLGSTIRKIEVSRSGVITPPPIALDWIRFERF